MENVITHKKSSSIVESTVSRKKSTGNTIIFIILCALVVVFLYPIMFIVINSFKGKFFISQNPFALPTAETFAGLTNYINGLEKTGFFSAMGWSFFITILSVAVIIFFTSMTAYYITRVKSKATNVLYYLFVFSMIVPFQMVMFPMVKLADTLNLSNPLGMVALYLGFGSGLSVFMFSGFIKSIPLEIEEAAMIDGCNPLQTYFHIVLPILKPTSITVAILNAMWVWNDYLLPYLVIGLSTKYKTIPVVIQMLVGSNGNRDMGAMMAMLVLAIIPIVVFYLACQKHIIEGVVAGAVKG
ncbi:MAG: carbohydrate ABC transporter permease [Clostridiales bacterium]|uniref:carbohydrate ABC transporter permease n=1 Tax=Terrisporobacter sp. TaxID=1965305 RepID=UPI002A409E44|nr:carbohydrate ABC transporter permease [Terrisporobacter sp.]MCI5628846.1 carbohydrate ABC transporter permease [Clostridium sp.]MDD5878769.1 carbohydrate ABC transporter permease [Clostridiales bacterium]MCI6458762.1 carbohydrate ABC transporter permease [Clostridium sp.]MCI7206069.1 carbohydrate ABC transporter permease [Clostridium sp.]MDY4735643.1 carbohydrate ABC transporter permease [Terrisporobacter sp.]